MELNFYKYQGAGNDFIIIDNRKQNLNSRDSKLFKSLCDRRFGIGADGLILLESAPGYDFKMYYANASGLEGSMCGNGGRCIVAFAQKIGLIEHNASFIASDGLHTAKISASIVRLSMINVNLINDFGEDQLLDTGSPHYVRMVNELESLDVFHLGQSIRNSEKFIQQGINVNFVKKTPELLYIRTYERGVEDETLACGTGVTAAALSVARIEKKFGFQKTEVSAQGGIMNVYFNSHENGSFTDIELEGPANLVFEGKIDV